MQPDLENIKNRVQLNRDLIDRIMRHVPGFKGYVEKAELYDADGVIRGFIGDRIQEMKDELMSLSGDLVKRGEHSSVSELESLNNKLERLYKKCKSLDFGKSASLSHAGINDEDLNRLLEYDWRMISSADEIIPLVRKLSTADSGSLGAAIREVEGKLKDFEKSFDERKNVLLEVI